jgi:hypothetical protein
LKRKRRRLERRFFNDSEAGDVGIEPVYGILTPLPRRTALIVPVPDAEPAVAAIRLRHDPFAKLGVPAHVTVLFPFAGSDAIDEAALAGILGPRRAFAFMLVAVRRFADENTYLAPDPPEPFVALTEAIWSRWPEHPPYGGTFATIIPHLTLGYGAVAFDGPLPIACHAREVRLIEEDGPGGSWLLRRSFALMA